MTGAFIILSIFLGIFLVMAGLLASAVNRLSGEVKAAESRIERLQYYRDVAVNDLHDLHFSLYTDKEEAAFASTEKAIERAKMLIEKAAKWDRLNGEGVQKVDLPTIPIRGRMLYWWPCGKALPMGTACDCEKCRSESEKVNLKFTAHNGPCHSEPLAPVMGCGDLNVQNVDRSYERFVENHAESLIPTADSIENAPAELPTPVEAFERSIRSSQSLPADFGIDRVLASAEQRSNCYG